VHVTECAPESVLDHAVHQRLVAGLHAVTHAVHVERCVRHRLLPAGDRDLEITSLDRLRREHDGLEPRATNLIDRDGGDRVGNAGLERRLTSGCLANAALDDVAHDDFFDVIEVDAGAPHGFANGNGPELGRRQRRESAEKPADRCPNCRHDDRRARCISHETNSRKRR
jgi:hypothetical protein